MIFTANVIFSDSDTNSETEKVSMGFGSKLQEIFSGSVEYCVRRTSGIYPGILTLPGTMGRGF